MEKIENHHIIPVSILWENTKANLQALLSSDHANLHDILNLQSRRYSSLVRRIREKTNHHILMRWETMMMRWDVQKEYFQNINKLPKQIQKIHIEKITENFNERNLKNIKLWNDTKLYTASGTDQEIFDTIHQSYIEVKSEICKTLYNKLKDI